MGLSASANLYAYANNSPVNANDPTGKQAVAAAALLDACLTGGCAELAAELLPEIEGGTAAAATTSGAAATTTAGLTGTGAAILAGKTVAGFGLGFAAGGDSTTSRVAAGITGALALDVGGPAADTLTEYYLPALGKFGNTALVSGVAGSGVELAAQTGDVLSGQQSQVDWAKVGYMGVTSSLASLTLGESTLAAAGDSADLGEIGQAMSETVGAVQTATGSVVSSAIWNGTLGANSSGSVNNTSGPAAGGYLIYPDAPNNNGLVNAYQK